MAQPTHQQPAYEVRCHHCDVSFPVGTKRCIHCGERIGRPRLFAPPPTDEEGLPVLHGPEHPAEAEEMEAEPSGGRYLRVGITLIWLVLAFITAAVRACQEGG